MRKIGSDYSNVQTGPYLLPEQVTNQTVKGIIPGLLRYVERNPNAIVDLSDVRKADAACAALLIIGKERNPDVRVVNASEKIQNMIRTQHLQDAFPGAFSPRS